MQSRETDITELDLVVLEISLETYLKDAHHFDSEEVFSANKPVAEKCLKILEEQKTKKQKFKFSNDDLRVINQSLHLRKAKIAFLTKRIDDDRKLESLNTQNESIDLLLHAFNA